MSSPLSPSLARKCWALLRQRCPRCAEGRVYAHGMDMNDRCPVCGLIFEREPGYFLGSLYVSYALAVAIMLLLMGLGHLLLPTWDPGTLVLLVGVCFLPLAPMVTRYARVVWIHFDRWAWPSQDGR
jgi:uncharacterized protein (DUF983 family)